SANDLGNSGSGGALSVTNSISLTITPVNDPPTFVRGDDITVLEDSGPYTAANWATNMSAGPSDESSQVVHFVLRTDQTNMFSSQPAVSTNGTLTFTPATNANGLAIVYATLVDDGGTANGGTNTS